MDCLFTPASVAIIGASHTPGKIGYEILNNFIKGGYEGRLYPVNPDPQPILGKRVFPNLKGIPEKVELAVIATPAPTVPAIVKECADSGVKCVVVISGGFSEAGPEGAALEEQIKETVRKTKGKMRLLGPNCIGVFDPYTHVDTLFNASDRMGKPAQGHIGFISQSGSVGITILDILSEEKMGLSKFISYENAADIDEADSLEYLGKDAMTKTILAFLEGVHDGHKFLGAAKRVSKDKPIIVLKGGKSQAGTKAAASHTASIAGSSKIYSGAFKQAGVLEAGNWEELFDFTKAFMQPLPKGRRIAIITNGGGFGVLAADASEANGLELPDMPEPIRGRMRKVVPDHIILRNPMDLTGGSTDDWYEMALKECLASDKFDGIILITIFSTPLLSDGIADKVIGLDRKGKPVICCTIGGSYTMRLTKKLEAAGLPVYPTPERAAAAMSALARYREMRERG
jgi:acetate---CoA ligase (ADP-forming)